SYRNLSRRGAGIMKSIFEERDHVRHCGAAEEGPQAAVPRRRCQNLSICNGQNESSMVSSLA
ncbi:hypothetical protein, partial [Rhizobium phaseoli]|uniref:hypothetical protein n=1 Tax=Rhizobium phaseoli TaxID=396 RepID=UPI001AEC7AD6